MSSDIGQKFGLYFLTTGIPFGITMGIFALIFWGISKIQMVLGVTVFAGSIFGFFMGIYLSYIMQNTTLRLEFNDKEEILKKIGVKLSQNGYYPDSEFEAQLIYKNKSIRGKLAGLISIDFENSILILVGPKYILRKALLES